MRLEKIIAMIVYFIFTVYIFVIWQGTLNVIDKGIPFRGEITGDIRDTSTLASRVNFSVTTPYNYYYDSKFISLSILLGFLVIGWCMIIKNINDN